MEVKHKLLRKLTNYSQRKCGFEEDFHTKTKCTARITSKTMLAVVNGKK